ncbi:putative nucleic acid-binding protein [Streptacidiphilus sp. MAP12-16]|uniref:hypothetical protein n=1 Tax=Streptacidiphilus sp. MAP12-16 TaxID=3156300 RepID=UPI003514BD0F
MNEVAVVGGTGALLAYYFGDEPDHAACRIALKTVGHLIISPNMGLTDAVSVALAAEFRTNAIFTVDRRHFRAVRPLTDHPAFRLLPDDLV